MVGSYPFLSQAPTPVEVELGCDNFTDSLRINKGVLTSVLQRSAQGWRPILNSGEKLCILCVDCVIIL